MKNAFRRLIHNDLLARCLQSRNVLCVSWHRYVTACVSHMVRGGSLLHTGTTAAGKGPQTRRLHGPPLHALLNPREMAPASHHCLRGQLPPRSLVDPSPGRGLVPSRRPCCGPSHSPFCLHQAAPRRMLLPAAPPLSSGDLAHLVTTAMATCRATEQASRKALTRATHTPERTVALKQNSDPQGRTEQPAVLGALLPSPLPEVSW